MHPLSRREADPIAKATTAKKTPQAPVQPRPRTVDISKAIAINVDPELRARVETVWRKHNELAPVPVSKSAIYRAVMARGVNGFEEDLKIRPPAV